MLGNELTPHQKIEKVLMIVAFIHEINGNHGMSIVGIFFIVFLFYIRMRIIRQKPSISLDISG